MGGKFSFSWLHVSSTQVYDLCNRKNKWSSICLSLIFLIHTETERQDTWCDRCRKCSCIHFLVCSQDAKAPISCQNTIHFVICLPVPTHCLSCQSSGSQLNPCQNCWTGLLIAVPREWLVGRKSCCQLNAHHGDYWRVQQFVLQSNDCTLRGYLL